MENTVRYFGLFSILKCRTIEDSAAGVWTVCRFAKFYFNKLIMELTAS